MFPYFVSTALLHWRGHGSKALRNTFCKTLFNKNTMREMLGALTEVRKGFAKGFPNGVETYKSDLLTNIVTK